MADRFDVVIVGAGPAGEHACGWLLDAGKRVALVESELIGGECSNWACIPTKTLLRPPEARAESARAAGVSEPSLDLPELKAYRDYMTSSQDDTARIEGYEGRGVTVVKSAGRLDGPGRVLAGDRVLEASAILIATGSEPIIPPIDGLEEAGYWTNREAVSFDAVPASVAILGGGPAGIELAQLFVRLGSAVSLAQSGDRLLGREDPHVGELIAGYLAEEGVDVRLGRAARSVRLDGAERVVELDEGAELRGEALIVATGRRPRTEGLGLESAGVEVGSRGIEIDERCRAADGVWAAGDVTGVMLLTHNGKYQARVAVAGMLGREARADYRAIPRVVFCDPETAAVGLTEAQARERGIDVATATIDLPSEIARPYTYERDPRGTLGVVADRAREVLVGAWAVAPLASEWIHQAGLAIRAEVPLEVLRDTVAQFPSYSEAYLSALRALGDAG